jgi:hypothetical protein
MSFDLAVWEGARPGSNEEAAAEDGRLDKKYVGGDRVEPTAAIKAFIAAITAKYPDLTDLPADQVDDGVWSDGPLINNASGPYFYFGIVWSRLAEVAPFVVAVAQEHGLVCFDPQENELL